MAKVICVTNQKGGVGKTTTAVNLAFYLAKEKYRTLLIDFDPQGNATSGMGVDKAALEKAYEPDSKVPGCSMTEVMLGTIGLLPVIQETKYKNLHIAPTTPQLANTEVELAKDKQRFTRLREAVKMIEGNYDYIIIDSPPSLSLLTVNGMITAEYLLLPVQTEFYAMEGVSQLLETMKLVKERLNPKLKLLGVLATMYDKRTSLSIQVLKEVEKYFKDKVFKTTIPRNVRVAEAPSHGVPVGAYDKFSKGAKAYRDLTREVISRTQK
ncbi:ParA family protein [Candidatus Saccharibacteria bacterium]|nr:ParA family protein [Candidatus Saccharibacteria bacterium]